MTSAMSSRSDPTDDSAHEGLRQLPFASEVLVTFPGIYWITDQAGQVVFSSGDLARLDQGIWRNWTREAAQGRVIHWAIRDV